MKPEPTTTRIAGSPRGFTPGRGETTADASFDRPPGPPRSVLLLTVLLGALASLGPLAIDMYLPSFPRIARDFGTTVDEVERTLASYFVGLSLGQLFYGPFSDRYGRKLPLYFGLTLFILASVGCALASSVPALVALRFLQALGGCAEMVVARAVVRDYFDERESARVFSSLMLVMGLAPILAPLAGGWLVVHVGWRAVFGAIAAFGVLCLAGSIAFLDESLPPGRRQSRSVGSTLQAYAALLGQREFMTYALTGGLISAGLFAYIGGSSFVFIELYGVSAQQFGLYFGANAFGLILASQVNGVLVRRVAPRRILRGALAVGAVGGVALLAAALTGAGGFSGLLAPLFVFVSSLGFIFPTMTALAMAPQGRAAGNASAVLGCTQFLISGAGGLLVSLLHNGTALPMAALIAGFATLALALNLTLPAGRESS